MGGNALSECVVFGALAGHEASQYARRTRAHSIEKGIIQKGEEQIVLWGEMALRSCRSPQEFKKRLAEIMFANAGIIRKGKQLEEARREVESLAEQAQVSMGCQNPKDVLQAIEVVNLIATSRLVLHGALRRAESRGSHYREDYPETDDRRWRLHLINGG
jgi:succinate dehydrogenase/fumarate reductase flavoprotein subunit